MVQLSDGEKGLIVGVIIIATLGAGAVFSLTQLSSGPLPCGYGSCAGKEAFSLEGYNINTPTNMTLTIRNVGTVAGSFVSSDTRLTTGQTYSNSTLSTPSFQPNTVENVTIAIDGAAFTFQQRNGYTVTLVSVRNNHFTFTVNT